MSRQVYAELSYSYSDSIGIYSITGAHIVSNIKPALNPPQAALVSCGSAVQTLSPSFGQSTSAGDVLLAWVFSNTGASSFNTTCSNPNWTLVDYAGAAFGWTSLWYRENCLAGETAPVFTSSGATGPYSQLAEFRNVGVLDQFGTATSGNQNITLAMGSTDTQSGDFVAGILFWAGGNQTPVTITASAVDSSGSAMTLNTTSTNQGTTGQNAYLFFWGQASNGIGPGVDTVTGSLSTFDGAQGIMGSFTPFQGFSTFTETLGLFGSVF